MTVDGGIELRQTGGTTATEARHGGRSRPAVPGRDRAGRRWAAAASSAVAALAGAGVALWIPHWPVLAGQALGTMAIAPTVGWIAGAAMRSRLAMLVAPAVFVAAFELAHLDATGPTVDAIDPTSGATLLASLAMRIVFALLAVLPMVVGAAYGRAWALRRAADPDAPAPATRGAGPVVRRWLTGVATVGLLVLAIAIARPATTAAILDADGEPLAGSIAEVTTVEIGGHDQRLLIRGHDATAPVLLFLAGGPGGSELGTMARWGSLLERDFVVVTWDQRGTGASYAAFEPAATLTVDRVVADTIELTEQLRDRFDAERVHLVGNSYGTVLGVLAAQQRPDLYASFVGAGQMVDVRETDRLFYADTLAWAQHTGDTATVDTLRDLGTPPYDDPLAMLPVTAGEHRWNDYSGVDGHQGTRDFMQHLGMPEYTLLDKVGALAGLVDTYAVLYPQLQDLDLRTAVPRLDVPVYLVEGRYEARGRIEPVREWFARLDAPSRQLLTFDLSGHRPFVEEPERFHRVMTGTVLAGTAPGETTARSAADPAAEPANELLDLFARYNADVWPGHLIAYAAALVALGLVLRRPGRTTDRVVAGMLAVMWLWLGAVYLGRYAAQVDPVLGAAYAVLFVVEAGLLARAGVVRHDLAFTTERGPGRWLGWTAIGYALVVYPLLGAALGHGWPQAPLFGMAPCPSVIVTFGLLLLTASPPPRHLLVIPLIWAILAPLAAVGHGVVEDLGLAVVGLLTVVIVLRATPRGRRAAAATIPQPHPWGRRSA